MAKSFVLALLCLLSSTIAISQTDTTGKKYIVSDSILIKTRDGVLISAILVRQAEVTTPQPTILQFTIYARETDVNRAKDVASHGYAAVIAYTRGKRNSNAELMPYEFDGRDVNEVIDWISKQPWGDGRVGMFGGSYNGFTQWAATKKLHPALKTIVPSVSVAPGFDVPMTNNVVMNFVFPWIYYVSNNKFLDEKDYRDTVWRSTFSRWFASGAAYASLDSILGRGKNKIFQRWLEHPSYDSYWQNMIPYKEEFAHINIPVLTTTGYFDGGQISALYYFKEHHKYIKHPEHYLLIGPWGHFGAQATPDSVYSGYRIDPSANISIKAVIYQWFDHIFKGEPLPAILKDKVNFEVMETNEWKHVPSLTKMANDTLKFYLSTQRTDTIYALSEHRQTKQDFVLQTVDFKDRNLLNVYYWAAQPIWNNIDSTNGVIYFSEPLKEDMIISGSFAGEIRASINKKDFDFSINLLEAQPNGNYFYLSYFMGRASYAWDKSKRKLLTPGKIETIPFSNTYITARKLAKGSRIVAIVNVNKSPFEQINYGTGKDVSRETIKDAGEPLKVKWYNSSFLKIPVLR